MQEWFEIPGFEGEVVINRNGLVKTKQRSVTFKKGGIKIINENYPKSHIDPGGYVHFVLSLYGKKKHLKLHRAMALAFVPNPNALPQINHIDGNKLNNSIENLEWCTPQQNSQHSYKIGLQKCRKGSTNGYSKLIESDVVNIWNDRKIKSAIELANLYRVTRATIEAIFRGDRWNHITGLPKRERDSNRRIIQGKNRYNYYTRTYGESPRKQPKYSQFSEERKQKSREACRKSRMRKKLAGTLPKGR